MTTNPTLDVNIKPLHSVAEAATLLGVSRTTMYSLISSGDLPITRI